MQPGAGQEIRAAAVNQRVRHRIGDRHDDQTGRVACAAAVEAPAPPQAPRGQAEAEPAPDAVPVGVPDRGTPPPPSPPKADALAHSDADPDAYGTTARAAHRFGVRDRRLGDDRRSVRPV